jgi:hypothetical protein
MMDGQLIQPEKLAILGLEVTRPTATSLQVSVVPFHLMLELDMASGQFSIAAPQSLFSGKFSGLCGEFPVLVHGSQRNVSLRIS